MNIPPIAPNAIAKRMSDTKQKGEKTQCVN